MSNFICTVNGTRDRNLDLYDNKCVAGKTQGELPVRTCSKCNARRSFFSSFRSKRTDVCVSQNSEILATRSVDLLTKRLSFMRQNVRSFCHETLELFVTKR